MILRLFISFITLLTAVTAHAGAWLQPEGHGLLITQGRYYASDSFFDVNGQKQPQQRYTKYELQPYVEYGLTNWLTIGGTAFAQRVSQSGEKNYGLADPEFFARTMLWQGERQVISLQPLIKFASYFRDSGTPRGGSSSTDAEISLLFGRNLTILSDRDYLDSSMGYRLRGNGRSPELRNNTTLGVHVTDDIQIIPAIRSVVVTTPDESSAFSQNGDLDSTYVTAEIGGLVKLDGTQSVQAAFSKTVYGIQSGDGYALSLGYAQSF